METKWRPLLAVRDAVEIILVVAFVILLAPLVEQIFVARGLAVTGINRIIAGAIIQIPWVAFAAILLALNGEGLATVGLNRPKNISATIFFGLLTAAIIFAVVVTLEHMGYGRDRLGDITTQLKNDPVFALCMTASVLVAASIEEFIFRGFILTRLANIFGDSNIAWVLAIIGQAVLFGLSHGYQHAYGMLLTGMIGAFLGLIFVYGGRNLWIVVIGHSVYDAAHALYLSGLLGQPV